MIYLKDIDKENWKEVVKLKVMIEQEKFIPSNLKSLAQSKVYPEYIPQAVYEDETLVGFVLHGPDLDTDRYFIYRIMIDKDYQGKGLGKGALKKLLENLKENGIEELFTSYEPENKVAQKFFSGRGFEETGELDHEEIVSRYKL